LLAESAEELRTLLNVI